MSLGLRLHAEAILNFQLMLGGVFLVTVTICFLDLLKKMFLVCMNIACRCFYFTLV